MTRVRASLRTAKIKIDGDTIGLCASTRGEEHVGIIPTEMRHQWRVPPIRL